jgi:RHS repeat-associated protein
VYDAVGNRTIQTRTLTSTQVITSVYDNANAKAPLRCRLTSVNGQAYTWDANCNLLNDGASQYVYDQANRVRVITQTTTVYNFRYNGNGDRLRQLVNSIGTTYTLDLMAGLVQVLNDGSNAYLYGNGRIAQANALNTEYFLTDGLGSVRQLANSAGSVTLAQRYDPFGNPLSSSGSGTSVWAFAGEARDATGLEYLRARYYSPGVGRFTARDPFGGYPASPQTLNRFAYALNNPIFLVDPSGFDPSTGQYGPGFIERANKESIWRNLPESGASDVWFKEAFTKDGQNPHPITRKVYLAIRERLVSGEFMNRSVSHLYQETRQIAKDALKGQLCTDLIAEWRESAHVALVVLAGIGRVDNDPREGAGPFGPGFIPNPDADNPRDMQGADTGWHFFYHAFLSFELLYAHEYRVPGIEFRLRGGIGNAVGFTRGKVQALLTKYRETSGDRFDSLTRIDSDAYSYAVAAGAFYEVVSTYDNKQRRDIEGQCQDINLGPVTISGKYPCSLEASTDSLENFKELMNRTDPRYDSGVRDPRLFARDMRANHLGAVFGISAFYHQDALPPAP